MINLAREEIISFAQAAQCVPPRRSGRHVNKSTIHRWATAGLYGVKLETLVLGGARVTSVEALQRFAEACTTEVDGLHASSGAA